MGVSTKAVACDVQNQITHEPAKTACGFELVRKLVQTNSCLMSLVTQMLLQSQGTNCMVYSNVRSEQAK